MTTKVIRKAVLAAASVCAVFFVVPAYSGSKSGQTIETAASEYLAALADGTLDGYLAHEEEYVDRAIQERQKVPSDMWAQREASLRSTAKAELQQAASKEIYIEGAVYLSRSRCYLIVQRGATVKVKEVGPWNDRGRRKVFYYVSYANQQNAPQIVLQNTNGKPRLVRSGVFSVNFKVYDQGNKVYLYVAESGCSTVAGTVTTWPVPPLSAEEVLRIAAPKMLPIEISKKVGVPYGGGQGWKEFIEAGLLIKSTLEKHGWTVSGFQIPSHGYYSFGGTIEPPVSAQQHVIGLITYVGGGVSHSVVLLEHAESKLLDFSVQEDKATATISTKFSGCTVFCDLWKEVRSMPAYVGYSIFMGAYGKYEPSFDLDGDVKTTVKFDWTPSLDWHLVKSRS